MQLKIPLQLNKTITETSINSNREFKRRKSFRIDE